MTDAGSALAWVVDLLQRHHIPFQAVGGLAARAYGATRPLVDLDFYIPMERFSELIPEIAPHVVWGPEHYQDENWDITFVKLSYAGQPIEFGDSTDAYFFDRTAGGWMRQEIDFDRSERREVLGVRVPVIPRAELIAYKRQLGRNVDALDLAEIDG
jgi:hypothetical protein